MPVKSIEGNQELIPGGDIRIRGNQWLREAWDSMNNKVARVPREAEIRRVIEHLLKIYPKICTSDRYYKYTG